MRPADGADAGADGSATIAAQDEEYQTSLAIDQVADSSPPRRRHGAHADK